MTADSVRHLYDRLRKELTPLYTDREATSIARIVFEIILEKAFIRFRYDMDLQLTQAQAAQLLHITRDLCSGKPLQYVIETAWFFKEKFRVTPAVLIPRPETEELIEWILADTKPLHNSPLHVLDMGTGSACIPIIIKKYCPAFQVYALDKYEAALSVAKQNANNILSDTAIHFFAYDILTDTDLKHTPLSEKKLDIIISNPPYIPWDEKELLSPQVRHFEPETALFVSDTNSFIFYEKIAAFSLRHLRKKGVIYFEVNEDLAENLLDTLYKRYPQWIYTLKKDSNDKFRFLKIVV